MMKLTTHDWVVDECVKPEIQGMQQVASTQSSFSTRTALKILSNGGNAADAAVAASLVDGVVNNLLTNHAGSVVGLYWDAASRRAYELNSIGVFPSGLAPFRPLPDVGHPLTSTPLSACIPGFIPGLGAIHERFGSLPWAELCGDAVEWAEEGFPMASYTYGLHARFLPITTYFAEGRALFLQKEGFLPSVGERFRNPALARTLRALATEGPAHFTEGGWARAFVAKANAMGWPITLSHMAEAEARWVEPFRYRHGEHEIVQLAPPQCQGVFCSILLGIFSALDTAASPPDSAEAIYDAAHALRWAEREVGYVNDPAIFDLPLATWRDPEYHRAIASVIEGSRPKADLSAHVRMLAGPGELPLDPAGTSANPTPVGSCELSIVDRHGNWVQMLNTMQTGGIPGMVVDGVSMLGSHAVFGALNAKFSTWLVPGSRSRFIVGNTLVLRDGKPAMGLGTPGSPFHHTGQVLLNLLDRKLSPWQAVDAPRVIGPIGDDYSVKVEDRLSASTRAGLARMGLKLRPGRPRDLDAGWFQMCWRDARTGLLGTCTDSRGIGVAGGLEN